MPTSFRPYDPEQSLLLPPSLRDWLPEGHLAYFVSDTVDLLDLSIFYEPYEEDGRRNQPFDPRMMLKVLLYAYATGTFSSRKIARKIEEDVAYRVLSAGNQPAHRTICEFRQRHLTAFKSLFIQVVKIAREAGAVKLGALAIDGTKVKANASKRKAMSYRRMLEQERRLETEIAALTAEAEAIDSAEDRDHGSESRGDELPAELRLRASRLSKIRQAKARLESRQAEADRAKGRSPDDPQGGTRRGPKFKRAFGVPHDKAQENFTDPESRIMKTTHGFDQCFNAQIAVDENSQMIVATGLTNNASDSGQLIPLLDELQRTQASLPTEVIADAGYRAEKTFRELEDRGIEGYISVSSTISTTNPALQATARMKQKLAGSTGTKRYRRRKAIVEPVVGWIKEVLGFRRFSMRGQAKVRAEWDLVCLALNVKRFRVLQLVS
jgi:transposase